MIFALCHHSFCYCFWSRSCACLLQLHMLSKTPLGKYYQSHHLQDLLINSAIMTIIMVTGHFPQAQVRVFFVSALASQTPCYWGHAHTQFSYDQLECVCALRMRILENRRVVRTRPNRIKPHSMRIGVLVRTGLYSVLLHVQVINCLSCFRIY